MARDGRGVTGTPATGQADQPSRVENEHLPRRLLRDGAQSLSDAELVSVLLHSSCRGTSAQVLAEDLLRDLGGLAGLGSADARLIERGGVGTVRAAILLAVRELAARFGRARILGREVLEQPEAIASYVTLRFGSADQEVLGCLFLDAKNCLLTDRELFRGTLSGISVEPRQILRAALWHGASSIILFHTHPSGDPTPSADDLEFTKRMASVSRLVGIRLADHLVVGGLGRWTSMARRGVL